MHGEMTRANRMADPHFRWRSEEMTRVEAFSDAVFAFAVTLLVVALEVPHTFEELSNSLKGFAAFAICFTLLVLVWHAHVKFFRRYGLQTNAASVLNCALLFVVLFYVYPLKFLFTFLVGMFTGGALLPHGPTNEPMLRGGGEVTSLMVIYGLGFAAVFFLLFLLYRHAYSLRATLELTPLEIHHTRAEMINHAGMVGFGLVSATLATILPSRLAGLAGFLYGGIGIFHWISGHVSRREHDRLLKAQQAEAAPPAAAQKA